jgi:predicted metal-dependent hydrolase
MRASITLVALPLVFSSLLGIHKKKHRTGDIRSRLDGRVYRVRKDVDNPAVSAEMLAELRRRIGVLLQYLKPAQNQYHERLIQRFPNTVIRENPLRRPSPSMTSYSINKGEEIILCLRNPNTGAMHDVDTLMYVLLHEVAHIACPEVGHTQLFVDIFADFLRIASMQAHVIKKTDYQTAPVHYCGMTISEKIV